ncbi:MAG: hypothetical protein J0L75_14260 [Spirochaetes bacterium]|nr:hypothetical protein [Spirochaetota bacterium]
MTSLKKLFYSSLLVLSTAPVWAADEAPAAGEKQSTPSPVQIIPHAELGFAAVLSHTYQSGANGTRFNFVTMGAQDTLFPYVRLSVDVAIGARNRVSFLYQPLTLNTRTVVGRNNSTGGLPLVIDDATFPVGTPIDLSYGFDFWRLSWMWDFAKAEDTILAAGVSFQIRNASIAFTSVDGKSRTVNQNIGPVPILKVRAARWFNPHFGLDLEADGFYAAGAVLNGSAKAFEGWIWDASLSAKTRLMPKVAAFVTLRSIGGGAQGNNAYSYVSSTTSVNPFTYNALATMAVTLGVSLE